MVEGGRSDAASLATRAARDGGDYVLNGRSFVSAGGRSDPT
jgi:alkylation response protein AidB-like acyl-CoA dehydrogenase